MAVQHNPAIFGHAHNMTTLRDHTDNMLPTPPSPMEEFDPDIILSKLTAAEKIDLLSGTPRNATYLSRRTCSFCKELIFGIRSPYRGLEFRQSGSQMAPMESVALDSSMDLQQLVFHAVLPWARPGTAHF